MSEKTETELPVKMLREESAAEVLDMASKTLRNWRVRGQGPPYKKVGGSVRYWLHELVEWVDREE